MFEEKEDENVLDYFDSESQNLSFSDETKIRKKMSFGTWLGTPKYRESIVSITNHSNKSRNQSHASLSGSRRNTAISISSATNKSQNLPSTTEVPTSSKE